MAGQPDNVVPLPGVEPEQIEGRDVVVVDEHGEVCPGCFERDAKISALRTEKNSWRVKAQNLERRFRALMRRDQLWPRGLEVFKHWQERTGHFKAKFSADRLELLRPYLEDEQIGVPGCKRAVDGRVASDWHMKRGEWARRPGPIHDHFEQIFESREKFEKAIGVWEDRNQPRLIANARLELARMMDGMRNKRARAMMARAFLLDEEGNPRERAKLLREIRALANQEETYGNSTSSDERLGPSTD